jgi:hypothetical protein
MRIKNPYTEGEPNYEVFMEGVAAERERLMKLLKLYHSRFGEGPIEESNTNMQMRYMYEFVSGKEAL